MIRVSSSEGGRPMGLINEMLFATEIHVVHLQYRVVFQ